MNDQNIDDYQLDEAATLSQTRQEGSEASSQDAYKVRLAQYTRDQRETQFRALRKLERLNRDFNESRPRFAKKYYDKLLPVYRVGDYSEDEFTELICDAFIGSMRMTNAFYQNPEVSVEEARQESESMPMLYRTIADAFLEPCPAHAYTCLQNLTPRMIFRRPWSIPICCVLGVRLSPGQNPMYAAVSQPTLASAQSSTAQLIPDYMSAIHPLRSGSNTFLPVRQDTTVSSLTSKKIYSRAQPIPKLLSRLADLAETCRLKNPRYYPLVSDMCRLYGIHLSQYHFDALPALSNETNVLNLAKKYMSVPMIAECGGSIEVPGSPKVEQMVWIAAWFRTCNLRLEAGAWLDKYVMMVPGFCTWKDKPQQMFNIRGILPLIPGQQMVGDPRDPFESHPEYRRQIQKMLQVTRVDDTTQLQHLIDSARFGGAIQSRTTFAEAVHPHAAVLVEGIIAVLSNVKALKKKLETSSNSAIYTIGLPRVPFEVFLFAVRALVAGHDYTSHTSLAIQKVFEAGIAAKCITDVPDSANEDISRVFTGTSSEVLNNVTLEIISAMMQSLLDGLYTGQFSFVVPTTSVSLDKIADGIMDALGKIGMAALDVAITLLRFLKAHHSTTWISLTASELQEDVHFVEEFVPSHPDSPMETLAVTLYFLQTLAQVNRQTGATGLQLVRTVDLKRTTSVSSAPRGSPQWIIFHVSRTFLDPQFSGVYRDAKKNFPTNMKIQRHREYISEAYFEHPFSSVALVLDLKPKVENGIGRHIDVFVSHLRQISMTSPLAHSDQGWLVIHGAVDRSGVQVWERDLGLKVKMRIYELYPTRDCPFVTVLEMPMSQIQFALDALLMLPSTLTQDTYMRGDAPIIPPSLAYLSRKPETFTALADVTRSMLALDLQNRKYTPHPGSSPFGQVEVYQNPSMHLVLSDEELLVLKSASVGVSVAFFRAKLGKPSDEPFTMAERSALKIYLAELSDNLSSGRRRIHSLQESPAFMAASFFLVRLRQNPLDEVLKSYLLRDLNVLSDEVGRATVQATMPLFEDQQIHPLD